MNETNALPPQQKNKVNSFILLMVSTLLMFVIAELIRYMLDSYELSAMFVSFCAGFILFTPLVSLVLHPLLHSQLKSHFKIKSSALLANVGLAMVVQMLFFLIWITDAIAIYSIYVDPNSFLAKAFNISSDNKGDFGLEFFAFNLFLAWFFALLSLTIGLMPCLIARIQNNGVVSNFVAAFQFTNKHKGLLSFHALLVSTSVVLPLLYAKYLFVLVFPTII